MQVKVNGYSVEDSYLMEQAESKSLMCLVNGDSLTVVFDVVMPCGYTNMCYSNTYSVSSLLKLFGESTDDSVTLCLVDEGTQGSKGSNMLVTLLWKTVMQVLADC